MNGTDNSKLSMDENIIKDELSIDKLYENFSLQASDLREVMDSFEMLKRKLGIEKLHGLELYRELKAKLGARNSKTWKAREVLNMIEKRANQKEYMEQTAAKGIRVLIVGAGPIGLRLAIDCILLGAEVVVMEKRDSFSRNNVLHLWPFTIEDLKQLGAKKFYGKFCAGAIDHISIRSLQCILLKLCLLLGVKIHYGVEFLEILEPNEEIGWHASVFPEDHPISLFEFDFIVGAEGARKSRMPGFDRKELRGKLALAITANFKNYYTREEAAVEEISGVAFIFNQKFFKDLKADTDIDLENIVYYKDDTHYFVMTAKKDSLLTKGVLREDYSDTIHLLDRNNIDEGRLWDYAIEAAAWSTELPKLDFAFNHHKKPDVALFDFTSIHQAEYAARAIRRGGKDLYLCLIGDALLEPFWPTGTGCARGFLGAMDTAWLIRGVGQGKKVLDLLCERECIFQRLPQTTPEKLQQNIKTYTIDPQSRYPNLHFHRIQPTSIKHLYDTDELFASPALQPISGRTKNTAGVAEGGAANVTEEKAVQSGSAVEDNKENIPKTASTKEGRAVTSPSRKPLMEKGEIHRAYYVNIDDESLHTLRDHRTLIKWLQSQVKPYGIVVNNLSSSWSNGMALCALIHRYRPDLIPNFNELSPENSVENNQLAFSVAEKHLAISSLIKPTEMTKPDKLAMFTYLSLFYELFEDAEPVELSVSTPAEAHRELSPLREEGSEGVLTSGEQMSSPEKSVTSPKKKKSRRRSRQMMRRGTKKSLATSPSSVERSWSSNVQRPRFTPPTSPTGKTNTPEVPSTLAIKENKAPVSTVSAAPRTPKSSRSRPLSSAGTSQFKVSAPDSSDFCYFCGKRVYLMERMSANGLFFHRNCFKCSHCNCKLKMGNYSLSKGEGGEKGKFFCSVHYRQLFMSNPEAINYSRADAPKREQSKTDLPAEEKSTQQMNSKPEQEMTKSKSVEDAMQRTEQVHISVEEVTEQSSELPENEAEVLSGDEHRELNGDLPTDEDLVPEDLVSNGVHLEEEIIEMVADLQANEEAGHGDLLEDEVGNANGDNLETVSMKLDQAPQQVIPKQLHVASTTDMSIENSSTLHVDDQFSHESEKQPTIVAVDKQVASPSHEPENPSPKPGVTDMSTCIPPHQNGDESEQITKTTVTALEEDIIPPIEDVISKIDMIAENAETSYAPSGDRSDSESVAKIAPEESEQTIKTSTATKKHHYTSSRQESENVTVTKRVAVDNETACQNGEPKQPMFSVRTPSQQKRSTPKPVRKAPAPPLHRQGSKQQTSSPKEKRNTPKPARKAPPPPSNHVVVNEDVEQISGESSSNASEEVPISPEPKAHSSSDSKVEVSESRKSRSSRSRSSSVEIDENVHRDLEQQRDQPLSNEQANSQMGKSSSSGRQAPVRPAPYRPSSGSPAPIRPAPVRPAPYSPAPVRPAPYSPPSDRQTSGNSTSAQSAGSGQTVPVRPAPYSPASDRRMSASPAPVRPAPYRPAGAGSSGIVKRLSMGFEQLEANAQENKIVLGAKGREKAKANLKKVPSTTELQPYKQLDIINEEKHLPRPVSPNSFRRPRSPCEWKGTLGRRRQQPEDVAHIPRSSATTLVSDRYTWSRKPKRGQRSVTRPMISSYATSDVAIQERRKQQRRFRDAQLIQREMSQLERQYDELEEVGRNIESALRDAEDGAQEDQLMKSWLSLVNERNGLVRKTAELSLKMKELELEDKQYEVDKELNELCQVSHHQMSKQQHKRFEELCELKLKVVEERNEIVMQTEEERVRELEEDETTSTMFDKHFGGGCDGSSSDEDEQQFREQQLPPANLRKNSVENGVPSNRTEKRKSSRLSSLLSIFSSK